MKASLSLDLDNKWSYMKTHGDPAWESLPSYLDILVPRVLNGLEKRGLRITFFIVGQDAAQPGHAEVLREIARRGHEIGNHSHVHEPWMHRRSETAIDDELARAEESIERATGERPRGFRGPGFTRSEKILETLVRRGYLYDASSLPTFIGPLARAYYFRNAKLSEAARREREDLFGSFADGFRPNRQHAIAVANGSIAEIPVTTFPLLRVPIHISYVLYLATIAPALALAYFRTALLCCKLTATEPSILLHPLDFLSGDECAGLGFFPAMGMERELKDRIVLSAIDALAAGFDVRPMRETVKVPAAQAASAVQEVARSYSSR
ncbi:MAG TPA: polysaccharide deacetylase family protein [Candidatus Tumulicola sp.]|nr:polysaccharide deacetylase family protein [Candidatus Tumulicola sp.]